MGQVMQCPPPRPRLSSAPTIVMTSTPAFRSSELVCVCTAECDDRTLRHLLDQLRHRDAQWEDSPTRAIVSSARRPR